MQVVADPRGSDKRNALLLSQAAEDHLEACVAFSAHSLWHPQMKAFK